MRIDPHVHCRDGRQNYKETIAHVLALGDEQGVDIVFDMPNTDPPILAARDVETRLALVPREHLPRYRLYVGATPYAQQLREAVTLVNTWNAVVGLKLYAGSSVGALAVTREADQQAVYRILAAADYRGVLAVHCEKDALCRAAFDPARPASHAAARPPAAEAEAVADQLQFAQEAGFKGTLHICHVSTAAALERITAGRRQMAVTCGVTPHHLLWSVNQMAGPEGLLYKVNPPLREPADTVALRQALKAGLIDWIETDHAPHPISEKLYPPYASGYPALCLYRNLVENILPAWGLTADTIRNVTCHNIQRIFGERKTAL